MKKYGIFAALLCLLCFWMTACGVSRVESDNLQESYWLAVPPRIDCLNFEKSIMY